MVVVYLEQELVLQAAVPPGLCIIMATWVQHAMEQTLGRIKAGERLQWG